MTEQFLNEFHRNNYRACLRDMASYAGHPLSIEDVLEQSRRLGRFTARVIPSESDTELGDSISE